MEMKFCQSCGMPMGETDELYGRNADGSKNEDYCMYCYDQGKFLEDRTMDEEIEACIPFMLESHKEMTAEQARAGMKEFFPTLKRWKQA